MTCNCLTELDDKLAAYNGVMEVTFSATGRTYPTIMVSKINPRGKRPPCAIPTFCPFCGTKYIFETGDRELSP